MSDDRLAALLDAVWSDAIITNVFGVENFWPDFVDMLRARGVTLAPELDVERLARAALAHSRAEAKAWADKGERGLVHVCNWHSTKCAAAIVAEYDRLAKEDQP